MTYRDRNVTNYTTRTKTWGRPYGVPGQKDNSWTVIGIIAFILVPWMLPVSPGVSEVICIFWYTIPLWFFAAWKKTKKMQVPPPTTDAAADQPDRPGHAWGG